MTIEHVTSDAVGRRTMLAGAGAAALAGLAAANAGPAAADSDTAAGSSSDAVINATPVTPTVGSAAVSGYNYRHLSFFDFTPEGSSPRSWGGYGVYTTSSDYLWASLDIPAGSRVRDIEWYLYNATGSTYSALGRVWTAGDGSLFGPLVDIPVSSGTGIRAFRASVSSANYGPFPLGCKVMLGISSPASGSLQVNGARVGLSNGGGSTGMMQSPERVYDSRSSGGRLSANSTRTITLPSAYCPVGSTGVIVNVTAIEPDAAGYLRVWPGQTSSTDTSVVSFRAGANTSNAVTVGVSTARTIKVRASQRTHLAVDVFGWIG